MSYIGSTPTTQSFIAGTDYFNGDGSTTAFTLSRNVVSVNDIEVVVNNVVQQPNTAYNVSGTTITFTSAPSAGTGNIYARYLSTTTQSITPSQNTVSYSTLNTDLQSGGYSSNFKNRIINGAMMIDQRNAGASVTAGSGNTYTLDRWEASSALASKFSVQQSSTAPTGFVNSLLVTSLAATTPATSDQYTIRQKIEGFNIADLGWGTANAATVTLSFWVRSSLTGTFGGSLENSGFGRSYPFTYVINAANTWEQKSITIAGDTSGTWLTTNGLGIMVNLALGAGASVSGTAGSWASADYRSATGATSVVGTNGATFYITGVQLEKGSTATSFDYRPYGSELALCQRYYEKISNTGNNAFCTGFASQATGFRGFLGFQTTKRATPSVSYSSAGSFIIQGAGTNYTPTSMGTVGFGTAGVYTQVATTALTLGQGLCLIDGSGSYVDFSAEL